MGTSERRGLRAIAEKLDLAGLPARLLVSAWQVSLPVALAFVLSGMAIVIACGYEICVDWMWHEVTLSGGFIALGTGTLAYLIDSLREYKEGDYPMDSDTLSQY